MISADGKVKPSQAQSAPGRPARSKPTAKPNSLDAGPGRNCARASRSAKPASSSHLRLAMNSARKYPICATGPPKQVRPSRRKTLRISSGEERSSGAIATSAMGAPVQLRTALCRGGAKIARDPPRFERSQELADLRSGRDSGGDEIATLDRKLRRPPALRQAQERRHAAPHNAACRRREQHAIAIEFGPPAIERTPLRRAITIEICGRLRQQRG